MSLQISNQFLYDSVQSAVQQTGLTASVNVTAFSEVSLVARAKFEQEIVIGGEKFSPQLYVFNKNTGSHAMKVLVGLYRFACSNGLIIPVLDGSAHALRIIHRDCKTTNQALAKLPDLLVEGLNSIHDVKESIVNMSLIDIGRDEHAISIIGNLSVNDDVKRRSIRHWVQPENRRAEDQPNTAWSLYNIVNEQIRMVHGFNLTALRQDTNLFNDVRDLVLDVNQYGVAA